MPLRPLTPEEFEKRLRKARTPEIRENAFGAPKRRFGLRKPIRKRIVPEVI